MPIRTLTTPLFRSVSPPGRRSASPMRRSEFHPDVDEVAGRAITPPPSETSGESLVEVVEISREGNEVTFGVKRNGKFLRMTKAVTIEGQHNSSNPNYRAAMEQFEQEARNLLDLKQRTFTLYTLENQTVKVRGDGSIFLKFDLAFPGAASECHCIPFENYDNTELMDALAEARRSSLISEASHRIEVIETSREGNTVTFGVLNDGEPLNLTQSVEFESPSFPSDPAYREAYTEFVGLVRALLDPSVNTRTLYEVENPKTETKGGESVVSFDLVMPGIETQRHSLPWPHVGNSLDELAEAKRQQAISQKTQVEVMHISAPVPINGGEQLVYTVSIQGFRPRRFIVPSIHSERFLMSSLVKHLKFLSHQKPEITITPKMRRGLRRTTPVFEVRINNDGKILKKDFPITLEEHQLQEQINQWLLSKAPKVNKPILYSSYELLTQPDDEVKSDREFKFEINASEVITINVTAETTFESAKKEALVKLNNILLKKALKNSPLSSKACSIAGQGGATVTLQTFSPDRNKMNEILHTISAALELATTDDTIGVFDGGNVPVSHYTDQLTSLIPVVGGVVLIGLGIYVINESHHLSHEIAAKRELIEALEAELLTEDGETERANELRKEIYFRRHELASQEKACRVGYGSGGAVLGSGLATTTYGTSELLGLGAAGAVAQGLAPGLSCLGYFMSAVLFANRTRNAHNKLQLIKQLEKKGQAILHNGNPEDDHLGEVLLKFCAHERASLTETRLDNGLTTAVTATGGTSALLATLAALGSAGFIAVNAATLGTPIIGTAIGAGVLAGGKYVRNKLIKRDLRDSKELREHEDPFLRSDQVLVSLAEHLLDNEELCDLFASYIDMDAELFAQKLREARDGVGAERELMDAGRFEVPRIPG